MENKLLIVDGHNLLFQMFYGMPNKIRNENGKSIHAVIGFIGALNKLIRLIEPTHCVIPIKEMKSYRNIKRIA